VPLRFCAKVKYFSAFWDYSMWPSRLLRKGGACTPSARMATPVGEMRKCERVYPCRFSSVYNFLSTTKNKFGSALLCVAVRRFLVDLRAATVAWRFSWPTEPRAVTNDQWRSPRAAVYICCYERPGTQQPQAPATVAFIQWCAGHSFTAVLRPVANIDKKIRTTHR